MIRRDFLPRGNGCVTRCPLVLTLVHSEEDKEVVTFNPSCDGEGEVSFENPNWDVIRREIEQRMVLKAGNNCNIVDEPIAIRLTSRHVPDLELVDLPGFTRNPKRNPIKKFLSFQTVALNCAYQH